MEEMNNGLLEPAAQGDPDAIERRPQARAAADRVSGPISKDFLKALADVFDESGREAVRHVRDEDPETYKNLFAQMFPKETTTGDIYTDAQMDWLCDAISARLAKAARNRVETIHEVQGSFPK
jgi:hypothetical protein